MTEEWRDVLDWEGIYEVSDYGRVRRSGAAPGARVGRILKASVTDEWGHLAVILHSNGMRKHRKVHTLVLEAFSGRRPAGLEGCHNNGDAADNRAQNLRWGTRSENSMDMVKHGRNNAGKTHCPRGHSYAAANLLIIPSRPEARYCRACNSERARAWGKGEEFSAANADAKYRQLMGLPKEAA